MSTATDPLFTKNLWRYFKDISDIPRESGNEKGVREYLLSFAAAHQFEAASDETGNVIIKVPATAGKEHVSPLAFQGHMDMVCVRGDTSTHDFLTEGIELIHEGDTLKGNDTTLGADNGIAIALMLDLFTDTEASHGPLEGIFTVEEETGLTGAFALQSDMVDSRHLINLDSEEEGIFYIGCAGGNEVDGDLEFTPTVVPKGMSQYELSVSGLLGGHSGAEIHLQRGNAIKIMARALYAMKKEYEFSLVSIQGGVRRNVIPGSCKTVITTDSDKDALQESFTAIMNKVRKELALSDPSMTWTFSECETPSVTSMSLETSVALINALILAPHGVLAMSEALKGVVETSANLAIITTEDNHVHMISSHRSSVESSRDHAAELTETAFSLSGAEISRGGEYPAWSPDPSSPLAAFCAQAYRNSTGKEPVITAIHAGLECGIINDRIEGMDSVSLGPDLEGVHSIHEKVSISSSERVAKFIRHLCSIIE